MRKGHLLAMACTIGLLATPVLAQGTSTQTPPAGGGAPKATTTTPPPSTKSSTSSHAMAKKAGGTMHMMHTAHASTVKGSASPQDNMADQLNAQSLQAAQQGRPFGATP